MKFYQNRWKTAKLGEKLQKSMKNLKNRWKSLENEKNNTFPGSNPGRQDSRQRNNTTELSRMPMHVTRTQIEDLKKTHPLWLARPGSGTKRLTEPCHCWAQRNKCEPYAQAKLINVAQLNHGSGVILPEPSIPEPWLRAEKLTWLSEAQFSISGAEAQDCVKYWDWHFTIKM